MLQNCRVFRSAQFFSTDHRLVVATLRLQLKSRGLPTSQSRLDVDRLRDPAVAESFAAELSDRIEEVDSADDTESLWNTFKTTTLEVAERCVGFRQTAKKGFVLTGTLGIIDRARSARLNEHQALYKELKHKTVRSLRADKET